MLRKKSIDEWALDYWLLQRYAKLALRIFYKKITINGRHNLPKNEAIILAPNHQNALMDAMVFVCTTEFQNVFLARADIFKGKLLIRFLTYLNIMPIYRIRDGIDNVKRNDEIFEKTLQVMRNKHNPLVMYPEGSHGDKRRLRNLVKGLFRIAFMAQEDYKDQTGVKIIPVGIDYGHYQNFGTTLFVNIGKPIEIAPYYNLYKENNVMGINKLKEDFALSLSKLMIDIQSKDYYDLFMSLRTIYNTSMRKKLNIHGNSLTDKFKADKEMIRILDKELEQDPEKIKFLDSIVSEYQSGLKSYRLRDWVMEKEKYSIFHIIIRSISLVALLPLFLFGFVHSYLPFEFTGSRAKRVKDPQFHSSYKYVMGMIAFPLTYIVVAVIIVILNWPTWLKIAYIVLLPLTGIFSFYYFIHMKKFWSKLRYSIFVSKRDHGIASLKKTRKSILDQMNSIVDSQI